MVGRKINELEWSKALQSGGRNINDISAVLMNSAAKNDITFLQVFAPLKTFEVILKELIKIKDFEGFVHAIEQGNIIEIAKILIDSGLRDDLDVQDHKGYTALMHAARFRNPEFLKILTEGGASLDVQSKTRGNTALMSATAFEMIENVKFLISAGANPNISSKNGFTAIHHAIIRGSSAMVKLLLESGVSTKVIKKLNSLEEYKGYLDIAYEMVQKNGLKTGLKTVSKDTAFEMLQEAGFKPVSKIDKEEIINNIQAYQEDLIKYILEGNTQAELALAAIKNLEQANIADSHVIKECLARLPSLENIDLYGACYNQEDFV